MCIYSPPIPSNRVSVWVSGGSNYVYETNKSEREAVTEATQDTPFSLVKSRSGPACRRAALESLLGKPKKPTKSARLRKSQMSTAVSFRSQTNEAKCYAIEAQFEFVDATADAAPPSLVALTCWLVAWHATDSGMAASVPELDAARS